MYLEKIVLENTGAIDRVDISTPFNEDKTPKPLLIVGENGTGKSILLSCMADAILEFQHKIFSQEEILTTKGLGYSYFKTSGGGNIKVGKDGKSLAYLRFKANDQIYEYLENPDNKFSAEECKVKTNNELKLNLGKRDKYITAINENNQTELKKSFTNGSYCYFPPNRFEAPHWINQNNKKDKTTKIHQVKYNDYLNKPFIVESVSDETNSWILDVFLDCQVEVEQDKNNKNLRIKSHSLDNAGVRINLLSPCKTNIEKILSKILKEEVIFSLNYRNNALSRIKIVNKSTSKEIIPSISNLSTGQSTLFNLFSIIIRYGETSNLGLKNQDMTGIVLIDEADLHLHSDLQKEVLPQLIKSFPKIQFIITTHSPLFLLGMEELFGSNGIEIREMPNGEIIPVERFREFEKAYEYFKNTKKFEEDIKQLINRTRDKVILFVEGKFDKQYLEKYLMIIKSDFLDKIEIKPIGKEDEKGAKNSNDQALKNTTEFLKLNLTIFNNKIIILHDPETKNIKEESLENKLFIRQMKLTENNTITAGIENLFEWEFLDKQLKVCFDKETLDKITNYTQEGILKNAKLDSKNKKILCDHICKNNSLTKEDFKNFEPIFEMIEGIINIF